MFKASNDDVTPEQAHQMEMIFVKSISELSSSISNA